MRALHCLTLKFSLCSVLSTEHRTLWGPHIAQVPQLPARSTWLTCTVHQQKCPTQPCCVKHRQSSWGKVIAFCWFAVYSVGLVWVGSFLLTVSLLSLFFSLSLCISMLSCCLRLSVLVSEGLIQWPICLCPRYKLFWDPYRGRGLQCLSHFWLWTLHKMQLCPFLFHPCESHGSVCKKMFSLPLVTET